MAHQQNPEPTRQYKRELRARERAKLTPEQRSVQRWLKWREQQKQRPSPTPELEKSTPGKSRQMQLDRDDRDDRRSRQRRIERSRDYGPEL